MKKPDLKIAMVGGMFIIMIYALMTFETPLDLPADVDLDFIELTPGILVTVVCMVITAYTRGTFAIPALFCVGLALSHLSNTMYDMGLITTQMLSGLAIGELQLWLIIISTIIGGIVTAMTL